jgi:hypothetical protein
MPEVPMLRWPPEKKLPFWQRQRPYEKQIQELREGIQKVLG